MEPGLSCRGINYDTGTNYAPGFVSGGPWQTAWVEHDMRTIRRDLHCNAVTVYGSSVDRLRTGARAALAAGLQVVVQPRFVDASAEALLRSLETAAAMAEELRAGADAVTFNVGAELSTFASGIVAGGDFTERIATLVNGGVSAEAYTGALNELLGEARAIVATAFGGPITYAAGFWERVEWAPFDLVGVNLYRDANNAAGYRDTLRKLNAHGKPVIITEFGCCTFKGAADRGGAGHDIIDWDRTPPLTGAHVRSEREQADHLTELLDIFAAEHVAGAFVFTFSEADLPHSADPRYDLDMGSYGVVKVLPDGDSATTRWEAKEAFHAVARKFRSAGQTGHDATATPRR